MIILDLPYQDKLDRETSPSLEGFGINTISYSDKIEQRTLMGASVEASRVAEWKVYYKLLQYATPEEVANGAESSIDVIRDFYKEAQLGFVRWKPFELPTTRIWRIEPNSLVVSNPSGCNFQANFSLKYMYNE